MQDIAAILALVLLTTFGIELAAGDSLFVAVLLIVAKGVGYWRALACSCAMYCRH
ncbi:MAG: hypothetical protein R3E79_06140 [Caldilineaceae bacterium]